MLRLEALAEAEEREKTATPATATEGSTTWSLIDEEE